MSGPEAAGGVDRRDRRRFEVLRTVYRKSRNLTISTSSHSSLTHMEEVREYQGTGWSW
jgi:hypothetical protein